MSEFKVLIDTPIGAVFIVSSAISVFIMLLIFMLKKGSDLHGVLGYIYFFGLTFCNYAAAMACYEGLLPFAAVVFSLPISTISLIIGMAVVIPSKKSLLRVKVHIVATCISSISVITSSLFYWYHFNISLLDSFKLIDTWSLALLASPVFLVGGIITYYFYLQANKYFEDILLRRKNSTTEAYTKLNNAPGSRMNTILKESPKESEKNDKRKQLEQ